MRKSNREKGWLGRRILYGIGVAAGAVFLFYFYLMLTR